jgi:DNA repair and recombination RAD54-like protein
MVDFTNPGVLGTQEDFRKKTLFPILRGREPDATDKQKQRMLDIQQEMSATVNNFILRRVNTLNAEHLPPKLVQVVCCNLTEIQQNMYAHLCNSKDMQHVLEGKQVNCLGSIQMLMKVRGVIVRLAGLPLFHCSPSWTSICFIPILRFQPTLTPILARLLLHHR